MSKLCFRKLKCWKLSRLGEFQQAEHFQIWEDMKWASKVRLDTYSTSYVVINQAHFIVYVKTNLEQENTTDPQYLLRTHQNLPGEDLEEREEVVSIPQVFKQISDVPPSLEHGNHENKWENNKHYLPTDCSYHLRLFAKAIDSRHINKTKYKCTSAMWKQHKLKCKCCQVFYVGDDFWFPQFKASDDMRNSK